MDLRAARDLLDLGQRHAETDPLADRDGRDVAHLVGAVVDAHGGAGDLVDLLGQRRPERRGEVAVGDGSTEGRRGRLLGIDVDELVSAAANAG